MPHYYHHCRRKGLYKPRFVGEKPTWAGGDDVFVSLGVTLSRGRGPTGARSIGEKRFLHRCLYQAQQFQSLGAPDGCQHQLYKQQ